MRAVVDIGSNSVKFLLGELSRGAPKIQAYASKVTRLAEKLDENGGMITPQALQRTEKAFEEFAQKLKGFPIEAIATAAARKAKNPEALRAIVKKTLGCEMRILSGSEEAEISRRGAFIAAKASLPNCPNFTFVDMGGASTEISFSENSAPKHSFNCGAVSFMEKLGLGEMPTSDKVWTNAKNKIADFFPATDFAPLQAYAQSRPDSQLVAVGGTLVIAAKIAHAGQPTNNPYGVPVKRSNLSALNERVRLMSQKERFQLPGMEAGREDILCGGLLALDHLMQSFGAPEIFITNWGLRHGLLFGTP